MKHWPFLLFFNLVFFVPNAKSTLLENCRNWLFKIPSMISEPPSIPVAIPTNPAFVAKKPFPLDFRLNFFNGEYVTDNPSSIRPGQIRIRPQYDNQLNLLSFALFMTIGGERRALFFSNIPKGTVGPFLSDLIDSAQMGFAHYLEVLPEGEILLRRARISPTYQHLLWGRLSLEDADLMEPDPSDPGTRYRPTVQTDLIAPANSYILQSGIYSTLSKTKENLPLPSWNLEVTSNGPQHIQLDLKLENNSQQLRFCPDRDWGQVNNAQDLLDGSESQDVIYQMVMNEGPDIFYLQPIIYKNDGVIDRSAESIRYHLVRSTDTVRKVWQQVLLSNATQLPRISAPLITARYDPTPITEAIPFLPFIPIQITGTFHAKIRVPGLPTTVELVPYPHRNSDNQQIYLVRGDFTYVQVPSPRPFADRWRFFIESDSETEFLIAREVWRNLNWEEDASFPSVRFGHASITLPLPPLIQKISAPPTPPPPKPTSTRTYRRISYSQNVRTPESATVRTFDLPTGLTMEIEGNFEAGRGTFTRQTLTFQFKPNEQVSVVPGTALELLPNGEFRLRRTRRVRSSGFEPDPTDVGSLFRAE